MSYKLTEIETLDNCIAIRKKMKLKAIPLCEEIFDINVKNSKIIPHN